MWGRNRISFGTLSDALRVSWNSGSGRFGSKRTISVGDTGSSDADLFLVELDVERQDPEFYAMLKLSTIEHSQRENRGDLERRSILLGLFVRQPSLREKKYFNKPFFWTISQFIFLTLDIKLQNERPIWWL